MTLSRQLITLIFLTFLLIFSGTFWISVDNTRSYLMLQLATQTQNAADSLGLSLVPHMQRKDIAAMDTMVNAVFDSGYYKSLTLSNMSGKVLISRENTASIDGVPQWFINWLPMPTPQGESVITTGWTQSGQLTLIAHPGFAYKKLWETSQQTFWWAIIALIASLLAVGLILRAILKPLDAVEHQALAICDREFPIVENIPRTRELKRVVLAMNKMSGKLQGLISKLSERAEQMQQQAQIDALTGLNNRHGFTAMLEHAIHDREQGGAGSLAVIRINGFADYNKQKGHQAGDALLIDIARILTRVATPYRMSTVARISGTDFAIILPQTDIDIADEFGQQLSSAVHNLATTLSLDALAHIGISLFDNNSEISTILAEADAALATALNREPDSYVIDTTKNTALGNLGWKQLIEQSMENQRIRLLAQPVFTAQTNTLYSEILIRISDMSDNNIPAGVFVSMVERLGLNHHLDRLVIEQTTRFLETGAVGPLAVNLSPNSIRDASFNSWLESHYQRHADVGHGLWFEISEQGMLQNIDQASAFIDFVHLHRGKIIMEHFGTRLSSFQTLRQLKVDYIKLSGSYTRGIADNRDNRFFLQTITDIAHGLDIEVIAEQVEKKSDADSLQSLGINALQGYYFGEPAALGR
ncbi:EAL domain-containing protein [Mariprofundus erugo]|uniref:EAL domain-containing protein n=1 Tax=Mariprofundus erugo TaxID=2528639 RepID=A0A5R9GRR4_9PROT|nr:EAL domain-containing protein [Mariprofundus erugo]TLS68946.1 EAL domain-containing protein [Mariprofundus erugo]TLS75240.1 EAL domain-containing protein [Mariprofundus erugo]